MPNLFYRATWALTLGLAGGFAPTLAEEVATRPVENRHFELSGEPRHTLWIPAGVEQRGQHVDVVFDFHGSPQLLCKNVRRAGLNCVVVSVQYGGFSSVYRVPFSEDRRLFATILDAALAKLRAQPDFADDVAWGKLAVTSFSAGFGAVREVLKTPEYFDEIDGLYLVDSLYCGYVGDGTDHIQTGVVHPGLMKDFLRYAEQAAAGKKVMIVTHCMQLTPGYASTSETADYLLDQLQLEAEPIDVVVKRADEPADKSSSEFKLYRQAKRKGFSLYGSTGLGGTDHVLHLRHMDYWLPKLPLAKQVSY